MKTKILRYKIRNDALKLDGSVKPEFFLEIVEQFLQGKIYCQPYNVWVDTVWVRIKRNIYGHSGWMIGVKENDEWIVNNSTCYKFNKILFDAIKHKLK